MAKPTPLIPISLPLYSGVDDNTATFLAEPEKTLKTSKNTRFSKKHEVHKAYGYEEIAEGEEGNFLEVNRKLFVFSSEGLAELTDEGLGQKEKVSKVFSSYRGVQRLLANNSIRVYQTFNLSDGSFLIVYSTERRSRVNVSTNDPSYSPYSIKMAHIRDNTRLKTFTLANLQAFSRVETAGNPFYLYRKDLENTPGKELLYHMPFFKGFKEDTFIYIYPQSFTPNRDEFAVSDVTKMVIKLLKYSAEDNFAFETIAEYRYFDFDSLFEYSNNYNGEPFFDFSVTNLIPNVFEVEFSYGRNNLRLTYDEANDAYTLERLAVPLASTGIIPTLPLYVRETSLGSRTFRVYSEPLEPNPTRKFDASGVDLDIGRSADDMYRASLISPNRISVEDIAEYYSNLIMNAGGLVDEEKGFFFFVFSKYAQINRMSNGRVIDFLAAKTSIRASEHGINDTVANIFFYPSLEGFFTEFVSFKDRSIRKTLYNVFPLSKPDAEGNMFFYENLGNNSGSISEVNIDGDLNIFKGGVLESFNAINPYKDVIFKSSYILPEKTNRLVFGV